MAEFSWVWTLEGLLRQAGFHPAKDLTKAVQRIREALDATRKRQPDHRIRLQAADQFLGFVGLNSTRLQLPEPTASPVAINIAIVSSEALGHAPEAHGVGVRFLGGDGDQA